MTRNHTPIPRGTRFGRLTVEEREFAIDEREVTSGRYIYYRCKCDCGTYATVRS